jgi:energy-coupling factor transporter transmembrane protein EcfT
MKLKSLFSQHASNVVFVVTVLVYLILVFIARELFPMSVFVLLTVLGFIALGLVLKSLTSQTSGEDE